GSASSQELAERTGYSERYAREWLECMTAGGYIDHDPATNRFSIPAEHKAVLVERDSPAYLLGMIAFFPSLISTIPKLMEAFRTGGGVPYEAYGKDTRDAIGLGNRPMFVNDYASKWIPAMPDVHSRLQKGGRALEVGVGQGWSSIELARGFPNVQIDAVEPDVESVKEAKQNAEKAGLAGRIKFHTTTAEDAKLEGPYDLVTAFECIHDMAYPVAALKRMRELAAPNGAVLIADEKAGDTLEENKNFFGHLFYNFSVLHCLPQAMVFPNAAGTGTVITPSTMRRYATEAGFSKVEILPIENPLWRFYRLTP
ncbi:MAG: class I SAM-dependent methyltransferase, partial [Chloroflexi bacterium]|nr:class I SAM-dependent methyltransferase [Chloroflexota bacterium]